jgi:hypothetical protein
MHDLFITHAWRYHDDWTRMGELLDRHLGRGWRNFSLPWHDPALDANTPLGGKLLRESLEKQVIPVSGVIFLGGVYASGSARKWFDLELEYARKHGKPVVAVPKFGETAVTPDVAALVDATCAWDAAALIAALAAPVGAAPP